MKNLHPFMRRIALAIVLAVACLPVLAQQQPAPDVPAEEPAPGVVEQQEASSPSRPGRVAANANLVGTRGEVNVDSDGFFSTGGVVLRPTPSFPYVNTVTGTSDANSAFTVHAASGVERFRVRGDGNVGIGTNAPGQRLDVSGNGLFTNASTIFADVSSINPVLKLKVGGTDGYYPTIFFATEADAEIGQIFGWKQSGLVVRSGLSLPIIMRTNASGGDAMVLYPSGNVGIGTPYYTPPAYKLEVRGSVYHTNQSSFLSDTSGTNYRMTLRAGTGGYFSILDLREDTGDLAGSIQGYKGNGLLIDSGPSRYMALRTNNGTVEAMRITNAGNIGIGTTTPNPAMKLDVAGNMNVSGTLTGGNIQAKYQDVAEWVPTVSDLTPGTVVVLDTRHDNHVTSSTRAYDTAVAGVVSAQPGLVLGEAGASKAMVATTGRVRVRADASQGPISIGDLLVTSDKPGLVMKSMPLDVQGVPMHRPGTVVGKALQALPDGEGEILVLLSLQ